MPDDDLTLEPDGPARAALVWLHGLGATAADFADLGRSLGVPGLRVLLPQRRRARSRYSAARKRPPGATSCRSRTAAS